MVAWAHVPSVIIVGTHKDVCDAAYLEEVRELVCCVSIIGVVVVVAAAKLLLNLLFSQFQLLYYFSHPSNSFVPSSQLLSTYKGKVRLLTFSLFII